VPEADSPLIEAKGLSKEFRSRRSGGATRAVDNVDLTIFRGETLGLVGESGCGKSTLGRLLIRLIEPSAGSVFYNFADLNRLTSAQLRACRRDLQIIFQDPFSSLNPRMTTGAILSEPFKIHRLGTAKERRFWVLEALDRVGIPREAVSRYPHEFSGGQRQRISIARALTLKPSFVVCDEPVSSLDVSVQSQIINLMLDLRQQLGLTYLFVSHNLAVVRQISTRVAVMYRGRIVEIGEIEQVFANPMHPYTRRLLAAVPISHPSMRGTRMGRSGDVPDSTETFRGCRFASRCPHVEPRCRDIDPNLEPIEADHFVACIPAAEGRLPPASINRNKVRECSGY
jgi:peptide/nickel transport system ATP-binding protein/oligopeptide transport system ATP-binding protein